LFVRESPWYLVYATNLNCKILFHDDLTLIDNQQKYRQIAKFSYLAVFLDKNTYHKCLMVSVL
jgi:hypothetical protein